MNERTTTSIACDVGGTNTGIALMQTRASRVDTLFRRSYPTSGIARLEDAVALFLEEAATAGLGARPESCCVSAAGLVADGKCTLTNASLTIDETALSSALSLPSRIVNDFSALTRGALSLDPGDAKRCAVLAPGMAGAAARATVLVIGAGTGLGSGFATYPPAGMGQGEAPIILPSEGGHIALPVYDDRSRRLHAFLQARSGGYPPEAENAVSGPGIANIFDFMLEHESRGDRLRRGDGQADVLALSRDERPALIATKARSGDPLCADTMGVFVELYARSAASLCAATLPRALWIAGGITAKNLHLLADDDRFMRAFLDHSNAAIRTILVSIPVYVVTDYTISLDGAALLASELMAKG